MGFFCRQTDLGEDKTRLVCTASLQHNLHALPGCGRKQVRMRYRKDVALQDAALASRMACLLALAPTRRPCVWSATADIAIFLLVVIVHICNRQTHSAVCSLRFPDLSLTLTLLLTLLTLLLTHDRPPALHSSPGLDELRKTRTGDWVACILGSLSFVWERADGPSSPFWLGALQHHQHHSCSLLVRSTCGLDSVTARALIDCCPSFLGLTLSNRPRRPRDSSAFEQAPLTGGPV